MRISTALFMSGSLLCLTLSMAHAGDEPLLPELPQGFDLTDLSESPTKLTPSLEPLKKINDTAPINPVAPAASDGAGTRIEWSGYVLMGVTYKNTRRR